MHAAKERDECRRKGKRATPNDVKTWREKADGETINHPRNGIHG